MLECRERGGRERQGSGCQIYLPYNVLAAEQIVKNINKSFEFRKYLQSLCKAVRNSFAAKEEFKNSFFLFLYLYICIFQCNQRQIDS